MKTQKLLVIVVSVCLMAFFNVVSFAQTTPVQPAPGGSVAKMAEFLAQMLAAEGYDVKLDDNKLTIGDQIILEMPSTLEESEDSGIRTSLGPQAVTSAYDSAEDKENSQLLQLCLNAANLNFEVTTALCNLYVNDFGQFICKTEAAFDLILSSLNCYALYGIDPPPPTGDVISVFVTGGFDQYQGDLGGLAGADAICQERAEAAGLPGTDWTAWLSDSTENAIGRIPDGQYQLVDGTQVADDKADLTDGKLKAAITLNEFGKPAAGRVWTGTDANGNGTVSNCDDWNSSESVGDWGFAGYDSGDFWTLIPPPDQCNLEHHLYCFGGLE